MKSHNIILSNAFSNSSDINGNIVRYRKSIIQNGGSIYYCNLYEE